MRVLFQNNTAEDCCDIPKTTQRYCKYFFQFIKIKNIGKDGALRR